LGNFFIFNPEKVFRFGKSESTAKVQKLTKSKICFGKKYLQKIVNSSKVMTFPASERLRNKKDKLKY